MMYAAGTGVQKDEAEAMRWFVKAAANGLARAWVNQAILYVQGTQTARDYDKAQALLGKAVTAGVEDAKPLLERVEAMRNRAAATQTANAAAPKAQ